MPSIDPRQIEVVDPSQAALFRQRTMPQRIELIAAANRSARAMIAATAKGLHPDWTEEQTEAEVARRMQRGSA